MNGNKCIFNDKLHATISRVLCSFRNHIPNYKSIQYDTFSKLSTKDFYLQNYYRKIVNDHRCSVLTEINLLFILFLKQTCKMKNETPSRAVNDLVGSRVFAVLHQGGVFTGLQEYQMA